MEHGGSTRWQRLAGGVAGVLALGVYVFRLDRVIGMQVDDAWYLVLAKAMATGQGYHLISAPTPGLMPFYPPGFPFLLSFVVRLAPDFPANVPLLKSVSILASLGAGAVIWWYFTRLRQTPWHFALSLAMAVTLAPLLVYLSTGLLMSEPVFLLVQTASIALVERGVREAAPNRFRLRILLGGLSAGFALLVRTAGVGLIVGGIVYLIWKRRRREAAIFALGSAALVGPWMVYAEINAPTIEQRREQNGYIVQPYSKQFWHRSAGSESRGVIGVAELPARVWTNAARMMTREAGELTAARLFYFLEDAGYGATLFSLLISLLVIAGYAGSCKSGATLSEFFIPPTLGIVLFWPWESIRFLLMLLPFGLFYLLIGARLIHQRLARRRGRTPGAGWKGLTIAATAIVAINLYGNIQYIVRGLAAAPADQPELIRAFVENEEMLLWMRDRLPKDAVVATTNPPLVYLYTGCRTISSEDPAGNWERWNRLGVRYLAYISPLPLPAPEPAEQRYRVIYRSTGELRLRIVDLGEPARREAWR